MQCDKCRNLERLNKYQSRIMIGLQKKGYDLDSANKETLRVLRKLAPIMKTHFCTMYCCDSRCSFYKGILENQKKAITAYLKRQQKDS